MKAALMALLAFGAALPAAPALFIDPGHGGTDKGVSAGALTEAEIAFDIAIQLQKLLKAQGLEAALSRSAAESPLPSARATEANASGARALLSLHVNHSPSPTVRGPRVFIPKALPASASGEPQRYKSAAGSRSEDAKPLALELAKSLSQSESAKVNVQNLNLAVFQGLVIPGVCVELGFLSHAESRERMADAAWRKALAARLAEAVMAWAGPLSPTAAP